jgi:hypothetical protein
MIYLSLVLAAGDSGVDVSSGVVYCTLALYVGASQVCVECCGHVGVVF